jgi:hypothetical protein
VAPCLFLYLFNRRNSIAMMMAIPTRDTETAIPAIAPADRPPPFAAEVWVEVGEEPELESEDKDGEVEVEVVDGAKLYPLTGTPRT